MELPRDCYQRATAFVTDPAGRLLVFDDDRVPAGLEQQVQHVFHLDLGAPTAPTWEWDECGDGDVPLHRFAFRWVDLDAAAAELWPIQAMWIEPLRCSLRRP